MPKLIMLSDAQPNGEFPLRVGINSLGRDEWNDVCIPDPSISTHHAEIIVDEDGIFFKDNGSTNGSFVDDEPVAEVYLYPGQVLRLGNVAFDIEDDPTGIVIGSEPAADVP